MGVEEATAAEAMSYDVFKQTRRDEATMMRNEGRGTGGGPWLEERWVADENDGGLRQCEVLQNIKSPAGRTDPKATRGTSSPACLLPPAAEALANAVAPFTE